MICRVFESPSSLSLFLPLCHFAVSILLDLEPSYVDLVPFLSLSLC